MQIRRCLFSDARASRCPISGATVPADPVNARGCLRRLAREPGIAVAVACGMKRTRPDQQPSLANVTVTLACGGGRGETIIEVSRDGVVLDDLECALIRFALAATEGNRTRAATFLGLSRSARLYRMHKHHVVWTSAPGSVR